MSENCCFDVLILGGGVVGLTVLRSATLHGWSCALVEAQEDLLSCASGSNSGIVCTGVDASPSTLERALIRDSISQIRPFCREHNVPFRDCGSLVCQWPWDSEEESRHDTSKLSAVLAESWDAGDSHASLLSPTEVKQMEPNLAPSCQGAVHIPGEVVVDPWLFSIALAVHARENGAKIYTNFFFDAEASTFDEEQKVWTAVRRSDDTESSAPRCIKARAIVNATGIQADLVQSKTNGAPPPHWSARPRRGQYRLFSSTDSTRITCPIQPVPTQRTKGIFVFSSLYDQLVVGPTALDQESRTDQKADPAIADLLTKHALRILPNLDPETYVGEYVGIRPGTDRRDYQIRLHSGKHWIAAAGIRSTGLTASLGIGRHVTHLLQSILPYPSNDNENVTTPLPPLEQLISDYHVRSDGSVVIQGRVYRVTHPITKYGWDCQSGVASNM